MRTSIIPILSGALALVSLGASPVTAPPRAPAPAAAPSSPARGARPFLWRIEGGGAKPGHLFGSIHLPSPEVTALAPEVERAFAGADTVYCEIPFDIGSMVKAAAAATGAARPLSQVLPPDLYARADAEMKRLVPALGLKLFERAEVWVVSTQLVVLEEQIKAPGVPPLDLMLYQRAQAAGKNVGGIETVEEQLAVMNGFSQRDQIDMLRAALDEMDAARERGESASAELLAAYLTGDVAVLERCARQMVSRYTPALWKTFEETLLIGRNRRMAERIGKRLREVPGESQFFALGALHLVGRESVLELLTAAGFRVTRVSPAAVPVAP